MTIKDPVISIDRDSQSYAIFDGFTLIKEFEPYTDEDRAIGEARIWLQNGRAEHAAKIVYPRITKMTMSTGRRKRK